jgi:hypothetical protein
MYLFRNEMFRRAQAPEIGWTTARDIAREVYRLCQYWVQFGEGPLSEGVVLSGSRGAFTHSTSKKHQPPTRSRSTFELVSEAVRRTCYCLRRSRRVGITSHGRSPGLLPCYGNAPQLHLRAGRRQRKGSGMIHEPNTPKPSHGIVDSRCCGRY